MPSVSVNETRQERTLGEQGSGKAHPDSPLLVRIGFRNRNQVTLIVSAEVLPVGQLLVGGRFTRSRHGIIWQESVMCRSDLNRIFPLRQPIKSQIR